MADWQIVIRHDTDKSYDVWLDEQDRTAEDDPGGNSLILGTASTEQAAILNALDELAAHTRTLTLCLTRKPPTEEN